MDDKYCSITKKTKNKNDINLNKNNDKINLVPHLPTVLTSG